MEEFGEYMAALDHSCPVKEGNLISFLTTIVDKVPLFLHATWCPCRRCARVQK